MYNYITGNLGNGKNKLKVNSIQKLKFENGNDVFMDRASCGVFHTVILSPQNDLICFGKNTTNQCSLKITSTQIKYPHILSRNDELKCIQNDYIEKAMALYDTTIIIINSSRKH